MQALPSVQVAPFALFGFVHTPVPLLHVPASWHWSSAPQTTGLAPVHVPAWQVSVCVQASPSTQLLPLGLAGLLHIPSAALHAPALWHGSSAVQITGLPPEHEPAWQVSVCVQALPSLQVEPLLLFGLLHAPELVLHTPTSWHWSSAEHVTGLSPWQLPAKHVSVCVQALPSLQVVPSALLGLVQTPVPLLHVPAVWQLSNAEQVTGLAPAQAPAWQVSVCVQASPSLQLVPLALAGLLHAPSAGLQTPALWHWSKAPHTTGLLPVHVPAWQLSDCVHALLSSHVVLSALAGLLHVPVCVSQVPAVWHWSCAVQVTRLLPVQVPV